MDKIGIKHHPTSRDNYLNPALSDGAIERLYPDQPRHAKQKYRLTEAAKEWKLLNQDCIVISVCPMSGTVLFSRGG